MTDKPEPAADEKRALDLVAASCFREMADFLEFGTPLSPAAEAWFAGLAATLNGHK